jgi:hypothetical protein
MTAVGGSWQVAVKSLGPVITRCMKQNNTIDIYEEYFEGDLQVRNPGSSDSRGATVVSFPCSLCGLCRTEVRATMYPLLCMCYVGKSTVLPGPTCP